MNETRHSRRIIPFVIGCILSGSLVCAVFILSDFKTVILSAFTTAPKEERPLRRPSTEIRKIPKEWELYDVYPKIEPKPTPKPTEFFYGDYLEITGGFYKGFRGIAVSESNDEILLQYDEKENHNGWEFKSSYFKHIPKKYLKKVPED